MKGITFITLVFTWMSIILMLPPLSSFVQSWCQRILVEMYKLNYAAACCLYYLYLEARNAAELRKDAMMQSLLSNVARMKTWNIFLSGGDATNLQHHTKAIILHSSGSIDAAGSVAVFCGLFSQVSMNFKSAACLSPQCLAALGFGALNYNSEHVN